MQKIPFSAMRTAVLCATTLFTVSWAWSQDASPSMLLAQNTAAPAAVTASSGVTSATADHAGKKTVQVEVDASKRWSIYWGWNRSTYSQSDIHFTGVDHDFTLRNVNATDLQTDVTVKDIYTYYLSPTGMTIPQTNLRLAYQLDANSALALNLDHMKYVVTQDQSVPIEGQILGVNQSGDQVIRDNWLNYEHTDGLNIVSLEYEKQRKVDWFGSNHRAKLFALVGLGIVIPKSNVTMRMINQGRNDEFHVAGYSAAIGGGLEVDVYKDVFFRTAYKYGYVNLPDVLTSGRGDKASQKFTFQELLIAVGMRF
jgi:opacity protein-like surface antigen